VSKLTVVIKRNASYEKGVYSLSIQNKLGGGANVQPIKSEADLLAKLLALGVPRSSAEVIKHLKNKHDSLKIEVDAA
jgi:hypothetical protein